MIYSLIQLLDFPDGTQFEDSEGDKELICTWIYDDDNILTLSTAWLKERFTKVEE